MPNKINKPFRLSIVAASLIAMSSPSLTHAQAIEEITVTGEKIERSIQDTASSVAVFTASQIEESAIYDLQEVFDRLANVSSANSAEGFTIRGINDRQVGAAGSSSLASLHIDGAFISRNGILSGQKDLWDVAQVEVFRGPQSTNQGRNSLAGAIFIRSNDPTYEPEGQYRVAYGTDNTTTASFAYGGAIIKDQLAYRVSIDNQETDGFTKNITLDDDEIGSNSNTTVRGKLLFEPAAIDGLSILTTLSYSDNESGDNRSSLIDANGNEISPFDNLDFSNIPSTDDTTQFIATTEINYEINDNWSFTSISSYNDDERIRRDDDDRQATSGPASNNRIETNETFSQEIRFNFSSDKLNANIGAYYFSNDNDEDLDDILAVSAVQEAIAGDTGIALATFGLNNTNPNFGPIGLVPQLSAGLSQFGIPFPTSASAAQVASIASDASLLFDNPFLLTNSGDRDQSINNYAIFANVEYHINDFITVFTGARYDSERVRTSGVIIGSSLSSSAGATEVASLSNSIASTLNVPAAALALSPAIQGGVDLAAATFINSINSQIDAFNDADNNDSTNSFSAFLPKVGVTLNWTDNLNTSFSIQRAYRAGGAGVTSGGQFQFNPEFTTNYDFSLRSQWFDNRLTVNANIFYVDWEDQQVVAVDPSALSAAEVFTVNAGASSLFGFELETSFIVNDSFNVYANIGYVETEFEDFIVTVDDGTTTSDLSGNEFNNAPPVTASAGFSYDLTSKLRLQSDINYQDASFDDLANEFENDSRTLVNTKVTYRFNDALEVAVVGRNIFDREYIVQSDEFSQNSVVTGTPRTLLVQLQGKF